MRLRPVLFLVPRHAILLGNRSRFGSLTWERSRVWAGACVAPANVPGDRVALLSMNPMVGAVDREVAQGGEFWFDSVQLRSVRGRDASSTSLAAAQPVTFGACAVRTYPNYDRLAQLDPIPGRAVGPQPPPVGHRDRPDQYSDERPTA